MNTTLLVSFKRSRTHVILTETTPLFQYSHIITNDSCTSSTIIHHIIKVYNVWYTIHYTTCPQWNHFQFILVIQHHIKNEHYSKHFCSPLSITFIQIFSTHSHHLTSHQKRTLLTRLLFTCFNHFQTNIFNSFSSSNITSKTNITEETSVHLFQSLSNKYFQLILIIQHHIENEHYSKHFCSPLPITCKQIFSNHSHHPTSHRKRTLLNRLLFISSNYF